MLDPTYDPRAALEIRRYHIWRVHRHQSVGEHTAQVLRIMLSVWPECPRRLLAYCVTHDAAEVIGDIPYPHKRDNPDFAREYRAVEARARAVMESEWGMPVLPPLSPVEETFFKCCENIEMWEYGVSEVNSGNRYAEMIVERMILAASHCRNRLVEMQFDGNVVKRISEYVLTRTDREKTDD